MKSAADLSLQEIWARLRGGTLSSVSLIDAAIERHDRFGHRLNAYRAFSPAAARTRAEEADRMFGAGVDKGPLQGVPVSIKDLYAVDGYSIYAGTPRPLPPSWQSQGPLVGRFQDQLAAIMGMTHTVEFALGGLGTNPHHGSPRNPWDAKDHRISGGSSSGAGVSLVEGSSLVALGSDTSGSVRMPASFTGTVGIKISHARWPTAGALPVTPLYLDSPGLLTRSVADLAFAFVAIENTIATGFRDRLAVVQSHSLASSRIGIARGLFWDDCSPGIAEAVDSALKELERHGATLVPIDLPEPDRVFAMFREGHLATAAVYSLIRNEFPQWWETLDSNVRDRLERYGAQLPAHEYVGRIRQIERWMEQTQIALSDMDAVAVPTIAVTPAKLSDLDEPSAAREHNVAASRNAAIFSLLGTVSLSLPVGLDAEGLPVGLMLAKHQGHDESLIAFAHACENVLGTSSSRLGVPPLIA